MLHITVKKLCEGYIDNLKDGIFWRGGRLNLISPYQREFIYKDAQRDALIDTVS